MHAYYVCTLLLYQVCVSGVVSCSRHTQRPRRAMLLFFRKQPLRLAVRCAQKQHTSEIQHASGITAAALQALAFVANSHGVCVGGWFTAGGRTTITYVFTFDATTKHTSSDHILGIRSNSYIWDAHVPPVRLSTPPGYRFTHNPKENLVSWIRYYKY